MLSMPRVPKGVKGGWRLKQVPDPPQHAAALGLLLAEGAEPEEPGPPLFQQGVEALSRERLDENMDSPKKQRPRETPWRPPARTSPCQASIE